MQKSCPFKLRADLGVMCKTQARVRIIIMKTLKNKFLLIPILSFILAIFSIENVAAKCDIETEITREESKRFYKIQKVWEEKFLNANYPLCEGEFKGGVEPSVEKLSEIIDAHEKWLETDGEKGKSANLCEADLSGFDLQNKDLTKVNFNGATLIRADLTNAYLNEATFIRANLTKANLTGTNLSLANFTKANLTRVFSEGDTQLIKTNLTNAKLTKVKLKEALFSRTILIGADLTDAILVEAIFEEAFLSKANLSGAILKGSKLNRTNICQADFRLADMENVLYEPTGTLPIVREMATVQNLHTMKFDEAPQALIELREAFKKGGFREKERKITYAIKFNEQQKKGWVERKLLWLFFDATAKYGMTPDNPIILISYGVAVFTIFYWYVIRFGQIKGKINIIWPIRNLKRHVITEEEGSFYRKNLKIRPSLNFVSEELRMLRIALYFSLLSAFHIGWREINVGSWMSRIQAKPYSLQATGWLRRLSGLQSIISVYLLAIAVLTYFGRPFE